MVSLENRSVTDSGKDVGLNIGEAFLKVDISTFTFSPPARECLTSTHRLKADVFTIDFHTRQKPSFH